MTLQSICVVAALLTCALVRGEPNTPVQERRIPIQGGVCQKTMQWSPDGKSLLCGNPVTAWEAASGNLTSLPFDSDSEQAFYDYDGSHIATCCSGGVLRIWEMSTGSFLETPRGHDAIESIGYGTQNYQFAARQFNNLTNVSTVTLWDASTAGVLKVIASYATTCNSGIVAYSERVDKIAISNCWGVPTDQILVFDVSVSGSAFNLSQQAFFAGGLAFSHDGSLIAAGVTSYAYHSGVALWNASTGEFVKEIKSQSYCQAHSDAYSMAFSPDDKFIALGLWCTITQPQWQQVATVMIIDTATGQLRADYKGHCGQNIPFHIAFSPSGQNIAVKCGNDVLILIAPQSVNATGNLLV